MMSEKNFFHLLKDYIAQVDSYLKTVVCTYHNILKNSLLQSINQEALNHLESSEAFDISH